MVVAHMPNTSGRATDGLAAPFYLAPLAEQKVIAEKLDELLAQVDILKTRLTTIPTLLKRFRQSVLAAAVSGKLTEEWRGKHGFNFSDWINSDVGSVSKVATGKTPSRAENRYWDNGHIPWLTSSSTGNEYTYSAEQFVTDFAVKDCGLKVFDIGTLLLAVAACI
jgi:type I restriction enzyme S subunit